MDFFIENHIENRNFSILSVLTFFYFWGRRHGAEPFQYTHIIDDHFRFTRLTRLIRFTRFTRSIRFHEEVP